MTAKTAGSSGPTEAGAIADIALRAALAPIEVQAEGGRRFLVIPEGMNVAKEFLADAHGMLTDPPPRVKQDVTVQSTDSLVDYVNRFKNPATTILFADIANNLIKAVIDYHKPDPAGGAGAFCAHSATLALPYSEEWKTWSSWSGNLRKQLEFARFLEENAADIVAPTGADLLEVCRDLQANRTVDFTRAVRTASDNENFEFSDETSARTKNGGLEIPAKFQLRIPVYFGDATTDVFAFLRWTLDPPNLSLGYVLHRAEHVRQAVFKQIVLDVGDRTSCPIVFGKP